MVKVRKTAPAQQEMFAAPAKRGGYRPNAGRKPKGPRPSERHETRERFPSRCPIHVNVRVERGVGQLRRRRAYNAMRRAVEITLRKTDFRVVHLSLQRFHIHFIVEATDAAALASGMQGLQISAARRLNAAVSLEREKVRKGRVFSDRYHARVLKTPTEVRNALGYVLNNWRHHGEDGGMWSMFWQIDPFSTASTFTGWKDLTSIDTAFDDLDEPSGLRYPLRTATPQTWLLSVGWKQVGLLKVDQVPGSHTRRAPKALRTWPFDNDSGPPNDASTPVDSHELGTSGVRIFRRAVPSGGLSFPGAFLGDAGFSGAFPRASRDRAADGLSSMAYREVTMVETKEVLRLWMGGGKKKRIAVQLSSDVNNVRRLRPRRGERRAVAGRRGADG